MPSYRNDPEVLEAVKTLNEPGRELITEKTDPHAKPLAEVLSSPAAEARAERTIKKLKKERYGEGLDPLTFMAHVMMNNLAALNLYGVPEGHVFTKEDNIPLKTRLDAAKDMAKYLYPQLKSTEIKTDITFNGTIESKQKVLVGVMDLLNQAARDKAISGSQPELIEHQPAESEPETK